MGANHSRSWIGDVIDGRYRLVSVLGQGGMGRVFRAEHIGIRREVAIKLLHTELRDDQQIHERVLREAFATGRLDHPNCVGITDSGMLEDGGMYLVMELLKGESLGDALDRRERIPVAEALLITRDILRGLAHAHSVGVVHRDLKPDNIFLLEGGTDNLVAKLLDFGIAKLLGEAAAEAGGGKLTAAGIAIGSPTYMSPEQACGGVVDGRSDLYSLSLILYEMLTGAPPFYEPDDRARALQRRLKDPPPALLLPSESTEVLPVGLQALVRAGLATNVGYRVETAEEYLRRLQAVMTASADEEVGAGVGGRSPRRDRILRNAGLAIAGLVVLAAAVALVGGFDSPPSLPSPSVALTPKRQDVQKEAVAEKAATHRDATFMATQLEKELDRVENEISQGRGVAQLSSVKKLQMLWPKNARAKYLLGLVYMAKHYWSDGFRALHEAISMEQSFRSKPALIRALLESLKSRSKPSLGQRFLVENVGAAAIPYLQEVAASGTERQRPYAAEALRQIEAAAP